MITSGGNWSSYPAHKHDEVTETESELEEIYYFEIAAGPDGAARVRLHAYVVLTRTRDRPAGRGARPGPGARARTAGTAPASPLPGFGMYYLNVMAGPGVERAWKISDHPDHAWVRGTWEHQDPDPRLTDPRPTAKDA